MEIAGMELERERILEIAVAVPGVLLFIALMTVLGMEFNQGGFDQTGGLAFVGAIALFIVVMSTVGLLLARAKNPVEGDDAIDGDNEDDAAETEAVEA